MQKKLLHQLTYINWRQEAKKINLTIGDFKRKKEELKATRHLAKSNTIRRDFRDEDSYTYSLKGYYNYLYLCEDGEYRIYISHTIDDSVNRELVNHTYNTPGVLSKKVISELFLEYNNCTEKKAFGYCDRATINKCVPKSLYYINDRFNNMNLNHVSKADFSSNYPSQLVGDMPDWHTKKVYKGTVKPTKEYPFAFYIKSGHSAEYKKYDTHEWMNNSLGIYMFNNKKTDFIPKDEDTTILCKKSSYNFDKVINTLYEAKLKETQVNGVDAKLVLNSAIGMMHRKNLDNKTYRLDHIATVVIARANQRMLDIYNTLDKLNINVLQIIVDGIIYQGTKPIGKEEKKLGVLVQEITDANFRMRGTNAYAFSKDGQIVQIKHGSYNKNLITNKLEDIDNWTKEI